MKKPAKKAHKGLAGPDKIESQTRRMTDADFAACKGQIIRLNRMPLAIPADTVVAYIGRSSSGRAVLLVSVNKLNNVPKSLSGRVQAVSAMWEPCGEQRVLIRPDGKIYAVLDNLPTAC